MHSSNAERALRLKFKINNSEISLIVDSGASCCLLDINYLPQKFREKINATQSIEVRGLNGVTHTLGTVSLFIEYNGYEYPITFHIVENLSPSIVGLVGMNFLRKFGAVIDFENSTMILREPLFHENFVIPARTEVVTFIETSFKEDLVILNQEIEPLVFIANALVSPVNGKIPVRLMNLKNKAVKVNDLKLLAKPFKNYDLIKIGSAYPHNVDRANKLLSELNFDGINEKDKVEITKLCLKFSDIFCLTDDKITVTKIYQPSLKVKPDTQPVYTRPYKLPQSQRDEVQRQVDKMLNDNIIEETVSEWNSPLLLVPKKSTDDSKKWRLVIDYRKLNNVLQDDKFPLPNIEEVIESLAGAKYFSM